MNVCVCSAFRNSQSYLTRYFAQVEMLRRKLGRRGDSLHLVLGEGDHIDETREKLPGWTKDFDAQIIQVDHGGYEYGPVVHPQRFRQLAYVWGCIWDWIPDNANVVVFLESDLIWHPNTMLALIERVIQGFPAVAPMVMDGPTSFYDIYAFRRHDAPFTKSPPYYRNPPQAGGIMRLDSAGSCLAMRGGLARKLLWDDEVIVGLCRQIHGQGESVWLDPALEVIHP